jgi:predicted dehydrogenase
MTDPTRRTFLQSTAATAGAALLSHGVHAAGGDTIRVGLIGCGARGSGAAVQALKADPNAKLVAIGDAFADQIDYYIKVIQREPDVAQRVDVPPERRFVGFDAYRHVIDAADVVLLCTPPGFRPLHLQAAIDAGKHVFMEKPVAVDAPGIHKIMETCERAKAKSLSVVSGLNWRYESHVRAAIRQVHDGAVGDVLTVQTAWLGAMPAKKFPMPRKPEWSDLEWQVRNWYWWTWLSGDHIVEQAVHSIDKGTWALGDQPPVAAVGLGGLQAQMAPERGQIFDHHAIIYEYPNDRRHFHYCRQLNNAARDSATRVYRSRGVCHVEGGTVKDLAGKQVWKYSGGKPNPYQVEHDALFAAIRSGKPINNGDYMARSTMIAILGRMATYTGQRVTWEQAPGAADGLDDVRRDRRPRVVLDRLHSRSAARTHPHRTAVDRRLGGSAPRHPVRHLVAGDDRNRGPGARRSPRASPDHSPRPDAGADHTGRPRPRNLVLCRRRGQRLHQDRGRDHVVPASLRVPRFRPQAVDRRHSGRIGGPSRA